MLYLGELFVSLKQLYHIAEFPSVSNWKIHIERQVDIRGIRF
jgi:hypothetical protein